MPSSDTSANQLSNVKESEDFPEETSFSVQFSETPMQDKSKILDHFASAKAQDVIAELPFEFDEQITVSKIIAPVNSMIGAAIETANMAASSHLVKVENDKQQLPSPLSALTALVTGSAAQPNEMSAIQTTVQNIIDTPSDRIVLSRASEPSQEALLAKTSETNKTAPAVSDIMSDFKIVVSNTDKIAQIGATALAGEVIFSTTSPAQQSALQVLPAQQNQNFFALPMREIPQTVVQATLKQERTLIRIDPPELGRIQLDFDHTNSGKTIVTLSAETDAARILLLERRNFMMGLFEGYGLDDVEIQIDNAFDSDNQKSNGQFFSNQGSPTDSKELGQNGSSPDLSESAAVPALNNSNTSPSEIETHRLHIRV